jgi:MFS superfamily sulfate permease-like transporter
MIFLVFGLFFSQGFSKLINIFPMPILGVILLVEALGLMVLVQDVSADHRQLWIAFMVAIAACALPYGFIIGLVVGVLAARFYSKRNY